MPLYFSGTYMKNDISIDELNDLTFEKFYFTSNTESHNESRKRQSAPPAIAYVLWLTKHSSIFGNYIKLEDFKNLNTFKKNDIAVFSCLLFLKLFDIADTYGYDVSFKYIKIQNSEYSI